MRYDLRRPCRDCPFRREGGCRVGAKHIERVATYKTPFPCHKTVRYESRYRWRDHGRAQACAGALAFQARQNGASKPIEIAKRRGCDVELIKAGGLFASRDELIEAHAR